jgi:hypothetical protein
MEQLKDNIENALQVVEKTAALFYQQKVQEGYERLDTALQCLIFTMNLIVAYQADRNEEIADEDLMNTALTEAMKAMEQKDIVLLADILIYEVNGLLEESLRRI